jgi:ATP-binding cassette subfamily B protein
MHGMGPAARAFRLSTTDAPAKGVTRGTVLRVLRFARPYYRVLGLFVAMIVVDAVLSVANPLIYREIIDRGILPKRESVVVYLAVLVAVIAVIDALLSLGERYISARVGEGLIYDLRTAVFGHVGRMPLAFFNRTRTGALVSRLNSDVLGAQQAFTNTLSSTVSNLITVAVTVAAMAFLSWPITIVALVLLPAFLLPARRIGRRLAELTRESYNLNASLTNTTTERFDVGGAMLVKLFGRPDAERASFAQRAGRVRDIGVQTAMYGRVFFLALVLTSSLATALVYGWGGALAVHGTLNVGTVVALVALLNRLYGPLTGLSTLNVDVMTALVSFDRVFEILDLAPMIDEAPDARAIPAGGVEVRFDGVEFAYPSADKVSLASLESVAVLDDRPSRQVLHGIDFSIEPGQLVALVGPSGAGKTTISALLPRLYDVDAGAIRLNGLDLREATFESLRDTVGVVTQDAHLFHDSIRDNLLFARPEASEAQLHQVLADAQLTELVEALPDGIDTVVGDRGYRLSGGEKQRLAIARLLLKAPRVVVLDEATAHLDSRSEAAIQQALGRALTGRTALVIAHRLSTVRAADAILVIADGRVAERGTHDELLTAGGLYAELYRTQFAGQEEDPLPV